MNSKFFSSLALSIETFMYRYRKKLYIIHLSFFLFFLLLLLVPLFSSPPHEGSTIFNNLQSLSSFLIWGLWFPLVFLSVLFTGRSWCGIFCPLGAASQWANRYGLKKRIPSWLRFEGFPIISFILITLLGQTLDVRDDPKGLAILFGMIFLAAMVIGFLYGTGGKKRAWCRHACPIGLLLGVFSRLSLLQLIPKQPRPTKEAYAERGVCPTFININEKNESRHCIACFRCVKPSSPGGLSLEFQSLGKEVKNIEHYHPNLSEVLFIFLGAGLSLGGFLWLILPWYQSVRQQVGTFFIERAWNWMITPGPVFLMSVQPSQGQTYYWLDFFTIQGFMLFYMFMSVFILTLTNGCSAWIATSPKKNFYQRFILLGYQYAPIAMISMLIGLGDVLFQTLGNMLTIEIAEIIKCILLLLGLLWSGRLGASLLNSLTVGSRRYLAMIPGFLGSVLIAWAWRPAIFGVGLSLLEKYRHHLQWLH